MTPLSPNKPIQKQRLSNRIISFCFDKVPVLLKALSRVYFNPVFEEKMAPKRPYRLCTVNTAPTRAKLVIGRVVEAVKEEYTIDYRANAERKIVLCALVILDGLDWYRERRSNL
jgi:hypothetical protein